LKFDRINAPIHEYLYKLQKIYNPVLPSSLRGNGNLGEDTSEKELKEQIENLEKRVQRMEHHSFIQQEDVT
jgi:hypothetical protein